MRRRVDCSRRRFLKAAGAGAAAPYAITSAALGAAGKAAASERIVMASIGVGGMGSGNLRGFLGSREVQVVAVCDVEKAHRERAKGYVDKKYNNSDCAATGDLREITRRDDVDAVVVCTPDHWHVPAALDAVKHGKDAYVEKPLTLTIRGGRILADAVRRYGGVLQTGSQQRSSWNFRFGCELVRNGRIGKLRTVRVGIPGNNKSCKPTWSPEPVPAGFDYDFWLGPAPWQPYHPQRCHYQFRFLLDYSGGQVTNWGAHHLDIAQWGIGADDGGPVEITGQGEFPKTGLFTTATRVHFECTYADGVKLTCKTGGGGTRFEGTDGWVYVNRGRLDAEPKSLLKEKIGPNEIHLYESASHKGNFLECVKERKRCIADVEIGHRSASICHLGNIAMLLNRTVKWDPKTETFPDDDEANRMTWRPARAPWST